MLDEIDRNPDDEPWLASFNRNGTDDREQDDSDWEPDVDDEHDFDGELCMPEWDGEEIGYTKPKSNHAKKK